MNLRPEPGQNLDRRNLLTLSGDDCDVSRQSSPVAQARAPGPPSLARAKPVASYGEVSPYADTYAVAVNLVVVESDGSRPGRPDYLRGGEQARRHRAACNRGHGLLRCCVELKWRWHFEPAQALSREMEARANRADHRFEMVNRIAIARCANLNSPSRAGLLLCRGSGHSASRVEGLQDGNGFQLAFVTADAAAPRLTRKPQNRPNRMAIIKHQAPSSTYRTGRNRGVV
jgi:hypothetical protein